MPERNLKGKGLRPRPREGQPEGEAEANSRDYSETASEISEEFAGASEIREKSERNPARIQAEFEKSSAEFGRNSVESPSVISAVFAAEFGRASAGLGHLIKVLQIRNPSSLRRGLDTLIKFLHKSGLLSSLRREIQVSSFTVTPPFIGRPWSTALFQASF